MPPDKIILERKGPRMGENAGNPTVSIPQAIAQHSPSGFEWGYGGSGPADLALNILHLFLPPGCDGMEAEKLFKGKCSFTAWALHQKFKWRFIACVPDEGGVIYAENVRDWIIGEGGYCGGML